MIAQPIRRTVRDRTPGFSLLEIIIAVAIMSLMLGAAIPLVSTQMERAKQKETQIELNTLKAALLGYFYDVWAFPDDLEDLWIDPGDVTEWVGPYLNPPLSTNSSTLPDITKDAWNQDYQLTYSGSSELKIQSRGRDGTLDTSDDLIILVDVTPLRRSDTLQELELLNLAILAYNKDYLATSPLPTAWTSLYARLVSTGYLPAGSTDLMTDGWGDDYQPDPAGQSPVVRVNSPNL
ncbi:MAG: type II secretion system protein GspG [Planctomycetes bacterium]|nr:type II secretion system protein GspG [Planctomycetota bacterium]